jgi:hypothetical protein
MRSIGNVSSVVIREYQAHIARSRNMGEGFGTKCLRAAWCLFFTGKAIRVGLLSTRSESLGEEVFYQGRRCTVSNWAGSSAPTLTGKNFYQKHCDRREIVSITGLGTLAHRFCVGLEFYMAHWHSIDVQKKLEYHRARQWGVS